MFFAKFFKIKIGLIGVFFVILLYIKIQLSSISVKIVVKNRDKNIYRYYLEQALKKYKKFDLKNSSKNNCNVKKLVIIRSKYYIEKK